MIEPCHRWQKQRLKALIRNITETVAWSIMFYKHFWKIHRKIPVKKWKPLGAVSCEFWKILWNSFLKNTSGKEMPLSAWRGNRSQVLYSLDNLKNVGRKTSKTAPSLLEKHATAHISERILQIFHVHLFYGIPPGDSFRFFPFFWWKLNGFYC